MTNEMYETMKQFAVFGLCGAFVGLILGEAVTCITRLVLWIIKKRKQKKTQD